MAYTAIQVEIQKLEKAIQAENELLTKALREDKLFSETKLIQMKINSLQNELKGLQSRIPPGEN